jgi:predicted O-linked N-acetylglucosamine transferase (SPINDLY family)
MKKRRTPPPRHQRQDFEALHSRALAEAQQGHAQAAFELFSRALAVDPRNAAAYSNRGNTLLDLKRFDEALASFDQALAIQPDFADALNNRGNALQALQRHAEAVDSYDRALAIRPGNAQALTHLGNVLQGLRRHEEALASYARALAIKPDQAEALTSRGNLLVDLKRFDDALTSYARALSVRPDYPHLLGNWVHTKMKVCDWSGLAAAFDHLAAGIAAGRPVASPFAILGTPLPSSLQRKCAEMLIAAKFPAVTSPGDTGFAARHDRIRLGYFSADFYSHATAYLMAGLFEAHDRSRFELVAFSSGPPASDPMRARLEAAFDRFIDVRETSDADIALLARSLEIDIAVDLKGFTQDGRTEIFARRAAPLQVSYLGYPGTMGADYIDYLIADRTLIPAEHVGDYAEKIAYLPHTYQSNDSRRAIADQQFTRQAAGLPEQGFVFCCFNNNWKITPAVFDIWMRLLQQVAGSVLWLFEDNPTAGRNLRAEAQKRGIAPERLVFAPRMNLPEHLARHRLADLFLDTLPYNAHTTASDALWAGLPVLTRLGETFAGRVAASLLKAVGLPELVTDSPEAYEALALELATDQQKLAALRQRLAANRLTQPLFDTALFARHIEAAYTAMWERHQAGLRPEHIVVPPS